MNYRFTLVISLLFTVCFCFIEAVLPQKVVICGVCRDIEERWPHIKIIIEEIGALFTDYRVIVYENNSSDNTVKLLHQWAAANPRISLTSEVLSDEYLEKIVANKSDTGEFFRPELIANARNIVLKKALSKKYDDFPYIIWIDMDFVVFPKLEGFIEVFTTDREWDAVFAYGIATNKAYWDWFALRYDSYPFGPELLGKEWYQMGSIREASFSLNEKSDWFPVYSAFGGCGVYKKSSIAGCSYSGIVTKDTEKLMRKVIDEGIKSSHPQALQYEKGLKELSGIISIKNGKASRNKKITDPTVGIVLNKSHDPVVWRMNTFTYQYPVLCEHIPFHASMIANGHDKLFINPRLVFVYKTYARQLIYDKEKGKWIPEHPDAYH